MPQNVSVCTGVWLALLLNEELQIITVIGFTLKELYSHLWFQPHAVSLQCEARIYWPGFISLVHVERPRFSCVSWSPTCAKDGAGAQGWSPRCSANKVGTKKGLMLWFTRIGNRKQTKKNLFVGSCALSQEEAHMSSCSGSSFQTWQSLMWQRTEQALLFCDPPILPGGWDHSETWQINHLWAELTLI